MIKILDQTIINKIAAGEVVERPASVVKELIENALDAKARRITVAVEEGGKKLIKVTDDGQGMDKADLEKCLQPHATSKISSINDLYKITTLGFRGEALASISSVSQFNIASKTKKQPHGYSLAFEHSPTSASPRQTSKPTALNTGTVVICRNLFYNIPARQKFLKSANTEFSHIINVFLLNALIHPLVAFNLTHNQRVIYQLRAENKWSSRLIELLGQETLDGFLPVNFAVADYQVKGYVSSPQKIETTPKHQYIFINLRPVRDFLILKAGKAAFEGFIMEKEQPNLLLAVTINPEKADVNVHPRKLEVKHENPGGIFAFIKAAVRQALRKSDFCLKGHSILDQPSVPAWSAGAKPRSYAKSSPFIKEPARLNYSIHGPVGGIKKAPTPATLLTTAAPRWRILGQLHKSYLAVENQEGLLLIDQHAAQERINYEQLNQELRRHQTIKKQLLAMPTTFELSLREKNTLATKLAVLNQLGWEIEPFGGHTFTLRSVPANLKIKDPTALIKDIIHDYQPEEELTALEDFKNKMMELIACRSAIKFGESLTTDQQYNLLQTLEKTSNNQACPHGRPIFYKFTLADLAKLFKRQ